MLVVRIIVGYYYQSAELRKNLYYKKQNDQKYPAGKKGYIIPTREYQYDCERSDLLYWSKPVGRPPEAL